MADIVLHDGDQVLFMPAFTPAIVMVMPGKITGKGKAASGGKPVCVAGDEGSVEVSGCNYITPSHPIPGSGTLKIAQLAGDQTSKSVKSDGKAVLLKGSLFTAKFEVQSPAQQPTPGGPVADPMKQYSGQGQFVPMVMTVKAG